jgi:hypothetical protein
VTYASICSGVGQVAPGRIVRAGVQRGYLVSALGAACHAAWCRTLLPPYPESARGLRAKDGSRQNLSNLSGYALPLR